MALQTIRWWLASGAFAVLAIASAGDKCFGEVLRKRATLRPGLPKAAYGYDDVCATAAVATSDGIEEQVLLLIGNPIFREIPASDVAPMQDAVKASADSILSRPSFNFIVPTTTTKTNSLTTDHAFTRSGYEPVTKSTRTTTTDSRTRLHLSIPGQQWTSQPNGTAQPTIVRRKTFAPTQPAITAEHVTLDRIGLTIYETGHVACTGLISHSGGPDGLVRGSNVCIKVRGYSVNRLTSPTRPNGSLHFETLKTLRATQECVDAVSLTPTECSETIRRHFDEITHLEVILESRRSR